MANNSKDILQKTQELLSAKAAEKEMERTRVERERRELITSLSQDIAKIVGPAINNLAVSQEVTFNKMRQMLREIKIEVPKMPEIRIPDIHVPQPKVQVNVPDVKIPAINIPKADPIKFPDRMSVTMDAVDNSRPLPVIMMDTKGKPMPFSMGAGGGGKADYLTIKDIRTSTGGSWFNDEGLKVSGSFSVTASNASTQAIDSSGDAYSQANPFPVTVVSGSTATTGSALVDSSGIQYSGSNPVPVVFSSSGTTAVYNLNAEGTYRDTFPVQGTVTVSSVTASTGVSLLGSDGLAFGTSKPVPVTMVTGVSASVNATIIDSAGNYRDTFPVSGTVVVSSVTASTQATIIDSTGIGYSGSNPVPVYNVNITGSGNSTIAVGSVAADAVDDGSAPVQIGGRARTTNPTKVADNDVAKASFDVVGRQIMRVNQVRSLLQTAYVTENEVEEVTLLAGATTFHDLVYILGANESNAAINLDIRQTKAGTVQMSLELPANGTAGVSLPMPIPQDEAGNSWTVQNSASDNSNTVYSVTALFSKEV
jgi:hypothetical protein